MTRFFIAPEKICSDRIVLTGDYVQHAKALRLRSGENIIVCDGQGTECLCLVDDLSADQILLRIVERRLSSSEPNVQVSVYVAFLKGDKLEHVIQKATELGAFEIVVYSSNRCVSRPDDKSIQKKLDRWQKIAASAAEQSCRGIVPQVIVVDSFVSALKRAATADLGIFFYENERATTLHMALQDSYHSVSLMSGPEGGFDDDEVELAKNNGLRICTLGRRILRCETAPLCALSALMYDSGEF